MLISITHIAGGKHFAHANHMATSLLKLPVELNGTAEGGRNGEHLQAMAPQTFYIGRYILAP